MGGMPKFVGGVGIRGRCAWTGCRYLDLPRVVYRSGYLFVFRRLCQF
jgi:hypothetical protein